MSTVLLIPMFQNLWNVLIPYDFTFHFVISIFYSFVIPTVFATLQCNRKVEFDKDNISNSK